MKKSQFANSQIRSRSGSPRTVRRCRSFAGSAASPRLTSSSDELRGMSLLTWAVKARAGSREPSVITKSLICGITAHYALFTDPSRTTYQMLER